ncbi:MAG: permease-like cell division protein FtsX [Oscillospiraceae bacterium]|nr:permease-like cell division protein FtsX [Oscillospiraceae bacterium]
MKVNRNRTFYYLKEGFSSIFAHSLMSFASVCIIAAFLIITGLFIMIAVNINATIGDLEAENVILAYVHDNQSENDARNLEPNILAVPNVSHVVFISREEAMESFIGRYGDTDRYRDLDPSTFRHRFAVYVYDVGYIVETQNALRYVQGIAAVNANPAIAGGLRTLRNIVSWISIVVIAVLLAISLFVMQNTIKLATFERREEIAIMKMVGATNAFIRWPFIVEGFILGLLGSLTAYIVTWSLYDVAARGVAEFAGFIRLVPISSNITVQVILLFVAVGFSVGVGGSGIALNRYLKV